MTTGDVKILESHPNYDRKVPIAVTGTGGAGKTTLINALFGRINEDSGPTRRTRHAEGTHADIVHPPGKKRLWLFPPRQRVEKAVFADIPGQQSDREQALDLVFSGGRSPTGVIHVFCWGYNEVWVKDSPRLDVATTKPTAEAQIEHLRSGYFDEELADFRATCERIKEAWQTPATEKRWVVLAITKCDLFWERRSEALAYYQKGPYREQVSWLQRNCHGDFRLAVVAVSAQPHPYAPAPTQLPQCRIEPTIDLATARKTIRELKAQIWTA